MYGRYVRKSRPERLDFGSLVDLEICWKVGVNQILKNEDMREYLWRSGEDT